MTDLLAQIAKLYAPYDSHEAFKEGFKAYQRNERKNPYDDGQEELGEAGKAWESGFEAAIRYQLATVGG